MQIKFVLLVIFSLILAGCSTTKQSRARDGETAKILGDYRERQEKRIKQATREYQRVFEDQMKQLDALGKSDFEQRMELQVMQLSDDLLMKWEEKTLPSQFRSSFYSALQKDFQAIEDVETNLATARQTYAAAYEDITLETKKLEAAQKTLEELATKPSTQRELTAFLKAVYKAYNDAQKERDNEENGQANGEKKEN